MPNTINLRLLDNKNIIAELNGIPLAQENSYKIIAGEENATIFNLASKPNQYINARYTVEMVNSQGYGIEETDIVQDTFALPIGMAVAGYGWVQIRAYLGDEKVPFMTLKVKVWNTLPNWKDGISSGSSSGLTTEEKEKVNKLIIDGTGDKFLANDGEYKKVSGSSVDLSAYQTKVDNSLNTNNKTIVGAINEVNAKPSGESIDVQINGVSIVEDGVANIPLDTKVDKSNTPLILYGTDAKGNQTAWNYRYSSNTKNTVAGRDSNGNIQVGTAANPKDATNKEYVDNATKLYRHTFWLELWGDQVETEHIHASIYITIYCRSATELTVKDLLNKYLDTETAGAPSVSCCGYYDDGGLTKKVVVAICSAENNETHELDSFCLACTDGTWVYLPKTFAYLGYYKILKL